jgi:diphthamide synthase (EF-2-diphthine--ammonia ligase)
MGLCFRCEHRARFLETNIKPRFECGEYETILHSCYMYRPVKPVILKKREGDKRPQFDSYIISARSEYEGMPHMDLNVEKLANGGSVLYWNFRK